jgi:hypothetical protein
MKKSKYHNQEIPAEKINTIIDNFLSTSKFQSNLNSLIISTLSNKKSVSMPRSKITEKICSNDYIRDVENEILENLFKTFEIDNYTQQDLIQPSFTIKETKKNIRDNANRKKDVIVVKESQISHITQFSSDNLNPSLDSGKLLSILIEEFLSCDDKLKIENYIGDLSNFESDLLIEHEKVFEMLNKVDHFLKQNISENNADNYLIPNIINFFSKISKNTNGKVLLESCIVFLNYFFYLVEKFYKSNFDITKFYKLSFNVECLSNMIQKFHVGRDMLVRRLDEEKLKIFIDKFFQCFLMNYSKNNPVYLEGEKVSSNFGLSTNFILLLFFLLDNDFAIFKIIFRNSSFRRYIIEKYEDSGIKNLPFIDSVSCANSIQKKYCFLWKHYSVLEQIFPNKKISKKFLIFCWVSIKMHFLGLILRFKSLRYKFYNCEENKKNEDSADTLNCHIHFCNVLNFISDVIFKTSNDEIYDLEDFNKDTLFYQVKEVLCDFILYCTSPSCMEKKLSLVNDLYLNTKYNQDKKFIWLLDDLLLAFKNNINSPDISHKYINVNTEKTQNLETENK